ncbi:MAG: C1 family peptidase [Maribacter sp.]
MRKYLFLLAFLTFVACNNDIDDKLDIDSDKNILETFEETTDAIFTDDDGQEYSLGVDASFCYGYPDISADIPDRLEGIEIPDNLPEAFDLSVFLPLVGNQGRQGSCVSWAVSYYMKSLQENIQHEERSVFSPSYTFNQIAKGDCGGGSGVSQTLNLLMEKGVASLESFPYIETQCDLQPEASVIEEAQSNKISDFKLLSGKNMVAEMKTLIADQKPIVLTVGLDKTFGEQDSLGLSAYREHKVTTKDIVGAHALLAIGFSDEFNAFKVVNSWGTGWGDNGFVWIDYKAFENILDPNYEFKIICEAYVAYDTID